MLISMPHGTSTILGVFQAIMALLAKPDELSALVIKLPCDEKFASEIFVVKPRRVLLRCKSAGRQKATNRKRIKGFAGSFRTSRAATGGSRQGRIE
jgi:hypothetical protein